MLTELCTGFFVCSFVVVACSAPYKSRGLHEKAESKAVGRFGCMQRVLC